MWGLGNVVRIVKCVCAYECLELGFGVESQTYDQHTHIHTHLGFYTHSVVKTVKQTGIDQRKSEK